MLLYKAQRETIREIKRGKEGWHGGEKDERGTVGRRRRGRERKEEPLTLWEHLAQLPP